MSARLAALAVLCVAAPAVGGVAAEGSEAIASKEKVEFFATDFDNDELLLFDVTFRGQNKPKVASGGSIVGLDGPWGLDVEPVGRRFAYVANSGGDSVAKVDIVSRAVVATIPVGKGPRGVAFTPDGTLVLVVNNGSKRVSLIDPATDKVIDTIRVKRKPLWVRVEPAGRFAAVNNLGSNSISVLELEQVAGRGAGTVTRVKDVWHFKKGVCRLSEGLDMDYHLDDDAFIVTWTCKTAADAPARAGQPGDEDPALLGAQSRAIGPDRTAFGFETTILDGRGSLDLRVPLAEFSLRLPRRRRVASFGCATEFWAAGAANPPQAFVWNGATFGVIPGMTILTPFSAAGDGQIVFFPPCEFPCDGVANVKQAAKIKISDNNSPPPKDMVYYTEPTDPSFFFDRNCYPR